MTPTPDSDPLKGPPPTRVCHVVCYQDTSYIRTTSLARALDSIPSVTYIPARNKHPNHFRYPETLLRVLLSRITKRPDVYILGFRGHEMFPFIRLLTVGRPLIFDAFMSPTLALSEDKKHGRLGKHVARLVRPMERFALRFSDNCITDTEAHRSAIAQAFSLSERDFSVVHVGADPTTASSFRTEVDSKVFQQDTSVSPLKVLFYGSFLPLHGAPFILDAFRMLEGHNIALTLIGGGKHAKGLLRKYADQFDPELIRHIDWVPKKQLVEEFIPRADVCLGGPFGLSRQAERIVTGKTIQCLSQSKPVIIGKNACSEAFKDKLNCIAIPRGNPKALAQALLWASENQDELSSIGAQGAALFTELFSTEAIAKQLRWAIEAVEEL